MLLKRNRRLIYAVPIMVTTGCTWCPSQTGALDGEEKYGQIPEEDGGVEYQKSHCDCIHEFGLPAVVDPEQQRCQERARYFNGQEPSLANPGLQERIQF